MAFIKVNELMKEIFQIFLNLHHDLRSTEGNHELSDSAG